MNAIFNKLKNNKKIIFSITILLPIFIQKIGRLRGIKKESLFESIILYGTGSISFFDWLIKNNHFKNYFYGAATFGFISNPLSLIARKIGIIILSFIFGLICNIIYSKTSKKKYLFSINNINRCKIIKFIIK